MLKQFIYQISWLSNILAVRLLSSGRPLVLYLLGYLLTHLSTSASHLPWLCQHFCPSISFPSLHDLVDHQTSFLVCHEGTEHPNQFKKLESCKVWETKSALCFQDRIFQNSVGYRKQQTKPDIFCLACFFKISLMVTLHLHKAVCSRQQLSLLVRFSLCLNESVSTAEAYYYLY